MANNYATQFSCDEDNTGFNITTRDQLILIETKLYSMREHIYQKKESVRHEFRLLHQLLDQQEQLVLGELDQLLATFEDEVSSKRDEMEYLLVAEKQLYPGSRGVKTNAVNNLYLEFQNQLQQKKENIINSKSLVEYDCIKFNWRKDEFKHSVRNICKLQHGESNCENESHDTTNNSDQPSVHGNRKSRHLSFSKLRRKSKTTNAFEDKNELHDSINMSYDYSAIQEPKWTAVRKGKQEDELWNPTGLTVDERTGNIFIADCIVNNNNNTTTTTTTTTTNNNNNNNNNNNGCGSIKIYSPEGVYLNSINGPSINKPWAICIESDKMYITCGSNSIHMFTIDDCSEVQSYFRMLCEPRGLVMHENSLYVTDRMNCHILVFSTNLNLIQSIELISLYITSATTKCYDVKISNDNMYVLFQHSDYPLQVFDMSGKLLSTLISNDFISISCFFSIDPRGSLIVSDFSHHCILVFTSTGNLLATIGKEGKNSGEFFKPFGIFLSGQKILVIDGKSHCMLQCF